MNQFAFYPPSRIEKGHNKCICSYQQLTTMPQRALYYSLLITKSAYFDDTVIKSHRMVVIDREYYKIVRSNYGKKNLPTK
jgi:hypothetical protein